MSLSHPRGNYWAAPVRTAQTKHTLQPLGRRHSLTWRARSACCQRPLLFLSAVLRAMSVLAGWKRKLQGNISDQKMNGLACPYKKIEYSWRICGFLFCFYFLLFAYLFERHSDRRGETLRQNFPPAVSLSIAYNRHVWVWPKPGAWDSPYIARTGGMIPCT